MSTVKLVFPDHLLKEVLSGKKRYTVRSSRKVNLGDTLIISGLDGDPKYQYDCIGVREVEITSPPYPYIRVGHRFLGPDERFRLAEDNGLGSWRGYIDHFKTLGGKYSLPFDGIMIEW